ncbi:MAG: ParA family protein [Advenella sp.]|nr:ParA family protein [Advenella sp.]
MSYALTVPERLLTWLDAERILKQETQLWSDLPPGINEINCYFDGLDITCTGDTQTVLDWLEKIFGKAFEATSNNEAHLLLRAGNAKYPVRLELLSQSTPPSKQPVYPLWREITYLQEAKASENAVSQSFELPPNFSDGPRLISFHSFKGGVGRTTALMTYAIARLYAQTRQETVKVLVVDADLEAPGVTFWLSEQHKPQVSFVHFLEAMHFPPESTEASLAFFAKELSKTSRHFDGLKRELFVLPAALSLGEIQDMPVQPSHLAQNPSNPWILTDHLHALGKLLGADAVFIDLRAGLSELSSPLIFDPRIEHYFVTTVAKQSIAGTSEILRNLHTFNSALPEDIRVNVKPSVIVSLLTPDLRRTPDYGKAKEMIELAYPASDSLDEGVEWLEVDFGPSLMSIGSFDDAFDLLKQSSLYTNSALPWAINSTSINSTDMAAPLPHASQTRQQFVQRLHDVCEKEYAELGSSDDCLVTDPLRNLGKHYSKDIPNAVLVGAKGAGKTFTYLQICHTQEWKTYLTKIGENDRVGETKNWLIFPLLWSSNVDNENKKIVHNARNHSYSLLNIKNQDLQLSEIKNKIKNNLESQEQSWDDFWQNLICQSLGTQANTLQALNHYLAGQEYSLIFLIDGLEDIFSDPTEPNQNEAIESLLTLVNRLGELPKQHIGALVFARMDYVQAAIKQNLGQFLSRFSAFQLNWDPESFLRLAYWLCAKANIINAKTSAAEILTINELIEKLTLLWGKKLGKNDSKEGYSARWVYAALCDLTGSFQARDLVRFFKFATQEELKNTKSQWNDRILSPESMRLAIRECSKEKVKEATLEIKPLRDWYNRMREENIPERQIPFSALSVKLQPKELVALRELGVIYEDTDPSLGDKRLYLPEIYRTGLEFELAGARPKIQALLKKNLGKMPF